MPGANPVVSGTINILGFYYFYHPREAHHRFSPGLALKNFPALRLEKEEKRKKGRRMRRKTNKPTHSLMPHLSSQDGISLVGFSYPDLSALSTGP